MKPWEIALTFKSDQIELPYEIFYYFSKRRQDGSQLAREREPSRRILLMSPLDYEGTLGKQGSQQQTSKRSWIVNGTVVKADGNFQGGLYFSKIGDTNIVIGAYPLSENDVQKMSERGITAAINLQTDEEFEARQLDWKQTKAMYKKHKVKIYRFPLNDLDDSSFCSSLFTGAQHLNSLLNAQGERQVFIHCSSGMSRAPAVVITYLCLFKKIKQWRDPLLVAQFVKAFHSNS